ncbi:hypothetical protein MUDAN_DOGOELCO_00625 [Lactiplantibacillus mudanjiangensis]|uniref:hypothetical protein n=1 Tax=Lactiplantibacillus mudanjiangensis TaxID=1296538 RepID=UPI0010156CDF|nr:hypothetical protein [Lactiplantibacillus mudanjiangensis]VDG31124.1 hypothetical protein MUDAN_DOGOELCO_00625 [Lactiplantibacillus mudanjiangensis]
MKATVVIKEMCAIVRYDNQIVLKLSFKNETIFISDVSPKTFEKKEQLLLSAIGTIFDDWSQNEEKIRGFFSFDYNDIKDHDATIDTFEQHPQSNLKIAYNIVANKSHNSGYTESEFITTDVTFSSGTEAESFFEETVQYGKIKYEFLGIDGETAKPDNRLKV